MATTTTAKRAGGGVRPPLAGQKRRKRLGARGCVESTTEWETTSGGLSIRAHRISCPLDHFAPVSVVEKSSSSAAAEELSVAGERSISVFVREVVDSAYATENESRLKRLESLLYLQGGPGHECTREGIGATSWIIAAARTHKFRVFLMDQRGTGYSSPLTVETIVAEGSPEQQLKLLLCFRADSIVEDAEVVRKALLAVDASSKDGDAGGGTDVDSGAKKWTILGQSYGGFCCYTYLSLHPHGLQRVLTTGGVPPVKQEGCTADVVYEYTMKRVEAQTKKYFERYPEDRALINSIARFVRNNRVDMPSGTRLSYQYLSALGIILGTAGGAERLHFLFERAWEDYTAVGDHDGTDQREPKLSYAFLKRCDDFFAFDTNPLYLIMHESIYCSGTCPGGPRWAAGRLNDRLSGKFNKEYQNGGFCFTGEMVFPWMVDEANGVKRLQPLREVANLLAEKESWSVLYDERVLAKNEVPIASLSYYDDMFVDVKLSQETVDMTKGVRHWVTSEYMHSGLREDGARIMQRLLQLADKQIPLF